MIVFRNVSKVYNMGGEQVRALWNANIHIKQGEFVAVVGPSGSGKSTLMNIVGCLDVASSGQYLLDGIPIDRYSEKQLAIVRNKKIGFIFQNFNLIQTMTAEENVELPLIYQGIGKNERKARVREALQKVDLYERRAHTPGQLSGGQQQRVAIARAMASKPSLFLADEPTGNLDQASIIRGTSGPLHVQQVAGCMSPSPSIPGLPVRRILRISSRACLCPRGVL